MTATSRSLTIMFDPKIAHGAPVVWGTLGTRATDLLDRIDAGDSVEAVATDFCCDPQSLELLLELRSVLAMSWDRMEKLGLGRPA